MARSPLPALVLAALGSPVLPASAIDLTGLPSFGSYATIVVQAPGKAPVGVDEYFRSDQVGQWATTGRAIDSGTPLATGGAAANTAAMSTYGRVSVSATGMSSLTTGQAGLVSATSGIVDVHANDNFTITCPTCQDGTRGSFSFRMVLNGDTRLLDTMAGADTFARAYLSTGAGIWARGVQDEIGPDGIPAGIAAFGSSRDERLENGQWTVSSGSGPALGVFEETVVFMFGEPIRLNLRMQLAWEASVTSGSGGASAGTSSSTMSFLDGIYWDGITGVRDRTGRAILDFTAISARTGVSYAGSLAAASAVPEPGTWLLMAGGLLLLSTRSARGRFGMRR